MSIKDSILEFAEYLRNDGNRNIFNEYCVQFYLAMWLTQNCQCEMILEENFRENNAQNESYLDLRAKKGGDNFAIEIKCPMVGDGLTSSMFKVWRDIGRLELLKKENKVRKGYFLLFTDIPRFWTGRENDPVAENKAMYQCFRKNGNSIHILNKMNSTQGRREINRDYEAMWLPRQELYAPMHENNKTFRYFVIEV